MNENEMDTFLEGDQVGDVQAHLRMNVTDEGDDVEGHLRMNLVEEEDDVEAHMRPRDLDKDIYDRGWLKES